MPPCQTKSVTFLPPTGRTARRPTTVGMLTGWRHGPRLTRAAWRECLSIIPVLYFSVVGKIRKRPAERPPAARGMPINAFLATLMPECRYRLLYQYSSPVAALYVYIGRYLAVWKLAH